MLDEPSEWKHDWEPQLLESDARHRSSATRFADMEHDARGARRGLRHALRVRMLRRRPSLHAGALSRPRAWCQGRCSSSSCSASWAASAPTRENLIHMKRIADKLFGARLPILGARRRPPPDADAVASPRRWAATFASGWRISLYDGRRAGEVQCRPGAHASARSSMSLSLEVATPAEAREMLALKGGDRVAF